MTSPLLSAERTPAYDAAEKPIRERQLAAYHKALEYIEGCRVLEIGCGEGIGTSLLAGKAASIVAVDYSEKALQIAAKRFGTENIEFTRMKVPPLDFEDGSFDAVICFQMIEHLEEAGGFVKEIRRVLRDDALALIATVNKAETISDNPYHLHEYTAAEFRDLLSMHFGAVELYGVFGDELFMRYWQNNQKWVKTFMRLDILNLSNRLPRGIKQRLFAAASRLMRTSLRRGDSELCGSITHENLVFRLDNTPKCLDFFAVCRKI